MGLTQLIQPFYRKLDDSFRRQPVVGQLGWTVVRTHNPVPQILDVKRADDRKHDAIEGEIRNFKDGDFRRKNRLPIYKLQLRDHEELFVERAKRRPAIVVWEGGTTFPDADRVLRQAGKKHLQERNIVVAPLYPCECPEHPAGFPPIMRNRIGALMYSQFFPCAGSSEPFMYDSVARLDRLQPIVPQAPTWEPMPVALADDALAVLLALLRLRAGSRLEQEISDLRDLLLETVKPEFKVALPQRPSAGASE